MERLTRLCKDTQDGKFASHVVGNYTGIYSNIEFGEAVEKLAYYEDLEEQGLLIILPCKCDEVVWVAEKGFKPHKALYSCPSAMLDDIEHGAGIGYTKEEAEAKLKELKSK